MEAKKTSRSTILERIDWSRRHEPHMRARIVAKHQPLANAIAKKQREKLPQRCDPNAIESAAYAGLLEAINHFDESIARFSTYANKIIKCRILDAMRAEDHLSRSTRKLVQLRQRTELGLSQKLGRPATREEMQAHTGMSDQQYNMSCSKIPATIETVDDERTARIDQAIPSKTDRLELPIERIEHFREITRGIDQQGRMILFLYYYCDQRMQDIGVVLGISESRVSQIHKDLLADLKKQGKDRFANK